MARHARGLTHLLPLSSGMVTIVSGLVVLLLWVPLRQPLGLGTVVNLVLVGVTADVALWALPTPDALPVRAVLLVVGVVLCAASGAIYLGSRGRGGVAEPLPSGVGRRTGRGMLKRAPRVGRLRSRVVVGRGSSWKLAVVTMVLRVEERTAGPSTAAQWQRNGLLAALPEAELARLGADLELVDLGLRQLLYEVDRPITAVYFPLDCVVSVVRLLDGETPIEVSTVGAEGMAGLPAFLGADTSPTRSFCQVPGQALRLEVPALRGFLHTGTSLAALLLRYTQVVMAELTQNVACNQLHSTEERCARWLAQTDDRVAGDGFPMTQDFLAQMLGVRRATVSHSARVLQQAGLIRYSRGRITVLDRDGLHAAACSCYRVLQQELAKS